MVTVDWGHHPMNRLDASLHVDMLISLQLMDLRTG